MGELSAAVLPPCEIPRHFRRLSRPNGPSLPSKINDGRIKGWRYEGVHDRRVSDRSPSSVTWHFLGVQSFVFCPSQERPPGAIHSPVSVLSLQRRGRT